MRAKTIIAFCVVITIVISAQVFAATEQPSEPDNYCEDLESWKEWDTLVQKHADDMDIQTLHALRLDYALRFNVEAYRFTTQPSCLITHINLLLTKNSSKKTYKKKKNACDLVKGKVEYSTIRG